MRTRLLTSALAFAMALTACGYKTPLALPKPDASAPKPAPAPATPAPDSTKPVSP